MKSPELRKAEIRANLSLSRFEAKMDELVEKVEATSTTLQDGYETLRRYGPFAAALAIGLTIYFVTRSFHKHRFKS